MFCYLEVCGFYVFGFVILVLVKMLFDDNVFDVIFVDLLFVVIRDLVGCLEELEIFVLIVCCFISEVSVDVVVVLCVGVVDFVLKFCNNDKGVLDDVIEKLFDWVCVNCFN